MDLESLPVISAILFSILLLFFLFRRGKGPKFDTSDKLNDLKELIDGITSLSKKKNLKGDDVTQFLSSAVQPFERKYLMVIDEYTKTRMQNLEIIEMGGASNFLTTENEYLNKENKQLLEIVSNFISNVPEE